MNARADELGIAHPSTRYPRTGDDLAEIGLAFPVILKPTFRDKRNAFVDAKAWRADDACSLRARYDEAAALVRADQIMVQELIPGDGAAQFSYAAVWDRGTPIGSLVARRARQYPIEFGFTSTSVETIELPEIEAIAARFLKSLDYNGLVEIEFKYDPRDRCYKILDVNTRAWTWIALGAAAGVDFPALQWRLAAGEKIAPLTARRGVRWLFASRDIAAATQEILTGRLSPAGYIRSWRRSAASAVFAWDDPLPAVLDLPLVVARVASRWLLRRNRGADSALQSASLHS
jgi:predicted ATP-grasp superfamily ATP-dependent carboligase